MGFLKEGSEDTLTPLGVSATEVNEAHPILLPLLYQGGGTKNLSAEEILTVLAAFLGEGGKEKEHIDVIQVPAAVKECLWSIQREAHRCQALEAARAPKDGYWEVNITWVELIWRWLQGASVQELCEDYESYEGNLMRMLLKLVNILEEWRSLASLAADVDALAKLQGVEENLLRDVAICDSLYLRL